MAANPRRSAPTTYEALKRAIADDYSAMSKQLQRIARYVLESPKSVALATVAKVATETGAQPSGIVRFAQSLGYEGFSDMQKVFQTLLVGGGDSYRDRIASMQAHGEGSSANAALAHGVDEGIVSLRLLEEWTSGDDLDRAAGLLAQALHIYVLAERRAFPVAFYLSYAISRLERRVHLLDGVGGMLRHQAANIRQDDILIGVSFPPYSTAVAETLAERSQTGVPCIAITDSPVSPIALEATISFPIRQQEEKGFRSLVAPMCLAEVLVVCLGRRLIATPEPSSHES